MIKFIKLIYLAWASMTLAQDSDVDLLTLQSNWSGNGQAILYPGMMKLLNSKSERQMGMMSTIAQLSAGDSWELAVDLKLACETEPNDFGVGLWLTANNPAISPMDYNFDGFQPAFGMTSAIDGLSLVYTRNSLHTSITTTQKATRANLLQRSKACKTSVGEDHTLRIKIKYKNKALSVYWYEPKDKRESLCLQFTDMERFASFYISASALVDKGKCQVDVRRMNLKQPTKLLQFVDSTDKKAGDTFFAYFASNDKSQNNLAWEEVGERFKLYRENSKMLAQELLEFADLNQKELGDKVTKQMRQQLDGIRKSVEVIGMEAQQLESLSVFIEQDRKKTSANVDDFSDQIIEWLNQMSNAYDRVDQETQKIFESMSKLGINDKLAAIIDKSERVINTLDSLLFKTQNLKKDPIISGLNEKKLRMWDTKVTNIKTRLEEGIRKDADQANSTLKSAAYLFLAAIGTSIFAGFGLMYYRIRKAIKHKQML